MMNKLILILLSIACALSLIIAFDLLEVEDTKVDLSSLDFSLIQESVEGDEFDVSISYFFHLNDSGRKQNPHIEELVYRIKETKDSTPPQEYQELVQFIQFRKTLSQPQAITADIDIEPTLHIKCIKAENNKKVFAISFSKLDLSLNKNTALNFLQRSTIKEIKKQIPILFSPPFDNQFEQPLKNLLTIFSLMKEGSVLITIENDVLTTVDLSYLIKRAKEKVDEAKHAKVDKENSEKTLEKLVDYIHYDIAYNQLQQLQKQFYFTNWKNISKIFLEDFKSDDTPDNIVLDINTMNLDQTYYIPYINFPHSTQIGPHSPLSGMFIESKLINIEENSYQASSTVYFRGEREDNNYLKTPLSLEVFTEFKRSNHQEEAKSVIDFSKMSIDAKIEMMMKIEKK